jgi:hypothetical protein
MDLAAMVADGSGGLRHMAMWRFVEAVRLRAVTYRDSAYGQVVGTGGTCQPML